MPEDGFYIENLGEFKQLLKWAERRCPVLVERVLESLGEYLLGEAKAALRDEQRPHARYEKRTRTVSRGMNAGQERNYLQYVGRVSDNSVDKGLLWNSLSRGSKGNVWSFNASSKTFSLKVGSAVEYARMINDGYTMNTPHWVPGVVDSNGIFRYQRGVKTGIYVKPREYKGVLFLDIGFKELEKVAPRLIKAQLQKFAEDFNHAS